MRNRKLKMSIISLIAHILLGIKWAFDGVVDIALWALLIGNINITIGIYNGANVLQKKIIGGNQGEDK